MPPEGEEDTILTQALGQCAPYLASETAAIVTLAAKFRQWYSPYVGKTIRHFVSRKTRNMGSDVGRGGDAMDDSGCA